MLPLPLLIAFAALGHRIMEARHLRGIRRRSTAASAGHEVRHEAWRKTSLVCGIVSSLLYGAMICVIRYEGYSLVSQVPSELTAIGAPTQALWMRLGSIYTVLVAAFGMGLWQSAGRKSPRANRGRADPGLRIPRAPVAVCRDAPTRGAGRRRSHVERHHARRARRRHGAPHVPRDRVWRRRIREAVPPLLHRQRCGAARVRRVDVLRSSAPAGESADTVDWAVGAHQHQRVPALGRGAGAVLWRTGTPQERRHMCRPCPFKIPEGEARVYPVRGAS